MRSLALGVILAAVALPCFAQTVLKSEPLVLAPYEIAFVQDRFVSGREGTQGDRRDSGAAPQESLRGARHRTGVSGGGDAVTRSPCQERKRQAEPRDLNPMGSVLLQLPAGRGPQQGSIANRRDLRANAAENPAGPRARLRPDSQQDLPADPPDKA